MNYSEAIDDIFKLYLDAVSGLGWTTHWEAVDVPRESGLTTFTTVVARHLEGRINSLGGVGHRDFKRSGMLMIGIYVPAGKGLSEAYAAAKIVADAYEGVSSENNVWFRNVRIAEQGMDGRFYHIDVIVDFEYYETK